MSDNKVSMLNAIQWWPTEQPPHLPTDIASWLMEQGSMTRRFKEHCGQVHVEPQQECFITSHELGAESEHLPSASERYWLREVIMYGDGVPWLLGRTLIPEESLSVHGQALMNLGTRPLGSYLFNSSNTLTREYIQIGSQGHLWARRSLLGLSGKPLLLSELFLAESPIYQSTHR